MYQYCKTNLLQIKTLLAALTDEQYSKPLAVFSGSSIGQHTRHILEFYACLEQGVSVQKVNYDLRKRDLRLEQNRQFTMSQIDDLCKYFLSDVKDCAIVLEADFDTESDDFLCINSSFYRELAYCLEHSIHHQALLKIGVLSLGLGACLPPHFGVAPSTIRHEKSAMTI